MPNRPQNPANQKNTGKANRIKKDKSLPNAIRDEKQSLSALLDSIQDEVWFADKDGKFTLVNEAGIKEFSPKLGEEKEVQKLAATLEVYRPDGTPRPVDEAPHLRALRGEIVRNQEEIVRRPATGESHYRLVSAAPVKNGAGKILGSISIVRDITELKRAEQETARLASFPILNPNPIVEMDLNENVLFINPNAQALFPDLQERGSGHPFVSGLKNALFKANTAQREVMAGERWYFQAINRIDELQRLRVYGFGITERKQAEEALLLANASLEQAVQERTSELSQRAAQLRALAGELTLAEQHERSRLANVLHDHLQQLLVAAKFRLTILGRGKDDVVNQAAKEVEQLIDESVAASRSLTAELSPPILHEAGLNAGLQWLARHMADTQGLFVDLELNESGPLPGDTKTLLFQSVRELLFNVVKHANTRSAMVNLQRFDSYLQVTVSDQGAGFDPAAMPAAGEGGRGFGLFGLRERLELMGGTLEIDSHPGQGSRFVLSLPVATSAANEPRRKESPVSPEARLLAAPQYPDPGRKICVMLADDHAIVRQGIANLLADEPDMEVVGQAADGQEAVEMAARLLPDVILMDMSMPKFNGVEATRAISNDCPDIRIIGLSMFEEKERAQAMLDAGAVNYLTKSGPSAELIDAIRKCMVSSHAFAPNR